MRFFAVVPAALGKFGFGGFEGMFRRFGFLHGFRFRATFVGGILRFAIGKQAAGLFVRRRFFCRAGVCFFLVFAGVCFFLVFAGVCFFLVFAGVCFFLVFAGVCFFLVFAGVCFFLVFA